METPLDRAHRAMEDAPQDEAARLHFFERLADGELFLLLAEEAADESLHPEVFQLSDGAYVLAFDREERLGAFLGRPAAYAALSGRALAAMLAGREMGIGLNLGAVSETLLPATAVDWLAATLAAEPSLIDALPKEVRPPAGLPERVLQALTVKLALAGGLARAAWLAAVTYDGGRRGHLLVFADALPGAEAALARAVSEALVFSGIEAGELDVAFLAGTDPNLPAFERAGVRFDLPREAAAEPRAAPGGDPDRPPRLR